MKSKIIKISNSMTDDNSLIIALCEDGSIWTSENLKSWKMFGKPFEGNKDKPGLRKVEFCEKGYYTSSYPDQKPGDINNGFFHGFFSEGDNENGIETYAIVEDNEGIVHTVSTAQMKFLK